MSSSNNNSSYVSSRYNKSVGFEPSGVVIDAKPQEVEKIFQAVRAALGLRGHRNIDFAEVEPSEKGVRSFHILSNEFPSV